MDLIKLIKTRRSIRSFDPDKPVTKTQIQKILEAAIWAPSSGNSQCWRFYVVEDPGLKKQLSSKAGHQPFIDQASVVIVVCADLDEIEKGYGSRGRNTYALQDTAAAIQNMLLTITDMGLGTCWIGAFDEKQASKILELPLSLRPVAMLPIGVPAKKPTPPSRKSIESVVTYR